ncbi:Peptidase S59, nucleoporin domain and Gamma-secretase subunit Aph-1 family and Nuclear protein 96 domain and Nucleoporin FG repeat-containing protein [Strongyloides ratti]|uniref:Nuclear pore complex protein Nup98-Nup96 n=1 Tax=Strongyloides ratti TaxID=34506 RepID=A0A090L2I8_STRRB|nr:Peptidase S59, nucleoporin domain and Gamma-secretase subunit Aph-1 family and Nuclear protein 96 domain and Nucleoporin FG repeat-containing protein [Strongyloides ratti]CEF64036.1 Peptidase S59, nucleoporin domain and Gamma-secretase subunit Aph-1 family and Nuclear protein 96 domain and Nucleoporin FG repeat-containing protein [Strongyloides ratti]
MNIIYTSTILVISLSLLYTSRIFTVINIIAIVFGAFASFLTLLISAIVWKIGSIFSDNIYLYAILAIVFQEITRAVLYYIFLYGEEQILKLESKKNTIKEHSTPMYKNLLEISIATGIGMGLTYQVFSMFGRSAFGSSNNSSSPFGTNTGFGSNQNKSAFGSPSTSTSSSFFGQQNKPQSLFGSSNSAGLFGSPNTGGTAFGTGNTGNSIFGSNNPATKSGGIFGNSNTNTGSSIFGSNTNKPSGGLFSSGFGSTTATQAVVGSTVKFEPLTLSDLMLKNGKSESIQAKLMCLTAMKQYEAKSIEEIRVEDYLANRKGPQATSTTGFFGSTTSNTSGGLFGNTNNTQNTGIFGTSTTQKPSLFGSTTQNTNSAFGSTNQTTSGGLFGNNTNTTNTTGGGLFGSQPASTGLFGSSNTSAQPTFGSPSTTSGGLFGNKPASTGFGTSTNTGTSLFGTPATSNTAFGTNTGTSTFGFGATATTQQSNTGFSFGNTTTATNAGSSIFGSKPTGTTSGFGTFGSTGTGFSSTTAAPNSNSIFGNTTANKPLFGSTSTSTTTGGGLFGQTPAQTTSLFGSTQPTQPTTGFGNQQMPSTTPQAAVSTQVVHQPIIIGSDVNQTAIQHALIDAQIAASPYGCSPLLKLSYDKKENKGKDDIQVTSPFSKQRQMKFLASKTVDPAGTISLAPVNKALAAPSNHKLSNSGVGGLQYKSFYSPKSGNDSLIYKDKSFSRVNPLANASSVSSTGELNMSVNSANVSSIANHSLLNKFSNSKNLSMKQVDPGLMQTLLKSTPGRGKNPENGYETPNTKNVGVVKRAPLSHSTPHEKNKINESEKADSEDASIISNKNNISADAGNSSLSVSENEPPAGIQVSSGHYYLRPAIEEMRKLVENGKVQLKKGLLISRQGYGSVYWPGPFELSNIVIDDVVVFKRREVTVYPDDENKPPLGEGLNRPAEISLECVWPVDPDTKEYIQDVERLEELNFRDRLERISLKNDSIFLDYKPSTGTWTFKVKHFSKYGFDDADENEAPIDSTVVIQQKQTLKRDNKIAVTPLGRSVNDVSMEDISSIQMATDCSSLYCDVDGNDDFQFMNNEHSFIDFQNPDLKNISYSRGGCDILKKKMKMDDLFNMSASLITGNTPFVDKRLEKSLIISLPISKKVVELKERKSICKIPFFVADSSLNLKMFENIHIDLNVFNIKKCSSSLNNNFIFMRKNNFDIEPINIVSEITLEKQCKLSSKLLDVDRCFTETESLMESDSNDRTEVMNTIKLLMEYIEVLNDNKSIINEEEISIYKFFISFFSPDNTTENLKLEGILNWVADEAIALNGCDTSENTGYKVIFEYICVGNVEKACEEAIKMNDFELASSLANHGMNDDLQCQSKIILDLWDMSNNNANQDEYLFKIYMILGNVYEHKLNNNKVIRWDSGLHWKVAFGIALLFMSSHKNTIKEVVNEFLKNTSCQIEKDDIIMSIIKLCCGLEDNSTSVAKALLTFSNYEDYRLCWHIMNVLVSLMSDKVDGTTMNTIHLYYAEQLFHSACYNDAFFVLEHLSNNDLKKIHVENYKRRMSNHLSTI